MLVGSLRERRRSPVYKKMLVLAACVGFLVGGFCAEYSYSASQDPILLKVTQTPGGILLEWTGKPNKKYNVMRDTDPQMSSPEIFEVKGTSWIEDPPYSGGLVFYGVVKKKDLP